MSELTVLPVLLSGGVGTRLWPLSRERAPKQLAPVIGARTMLEDTLARLAGLPVSAPLVVANEAHRFGVAESLRRAGVRPRGIVLEPVGRSTAPALAISALLAEGDPLILALPTDHFLPDAEGFARSVRAASVAAADGRIALFGVVPDSPHTGYGWVRQGAPLGADAWEIARFAEKPSAELAASYLAQGGWVWNSGMFLFRASVLLAELRRFAPALLAACEEAVTGITVDGDFRRLPPSFASCPADSVDYAVMERTDRGALVPLGSAWSDLGSWSALWENSARDAQGNATSGDAVLLDSRGCLVRADHRLVVAVDVEDLVIVETGDAVLVTPRASAERVKDAVRVLKDAGRSEVVEPSRVSRPWGCYERLAEGPRFQVKTIRVEPGQSLSLQRHQHRAEHWVVVRGEAVVRIGDVERRLGQNESTYIPPGVLHRLENRGDEVLEVVEVQTGGYLGEDDVERVEDRYGRS